MPRRARHALIGAGATGSLLILTWFLAFHVGVFARADEKILSGFTGLNRPHVEPVALWIARLCNPNPYVFLAAIPVLVALARRRVRVAAVLAAALLGANLTTQLLKPLLAHPRAASLFGGISPVAPGSWPSGHATAAMTLALTSVVAAPSRWRPYVAAAGALFAIAVSYSFLTLEWHYPSDVFGGYLVAATWTLLAVAAILHSDARQPRGAERATRTLSMREALVPPALAVGGAALLAALVALVRPHAVAAYAQQHTAFVVGAVAIGALGLTLATGLVLVLRREVPGRPGGAPG
jgi:membrane-associated phospholipid phosphatase